MSNTFSQVRSRILYSNTGSAITSGSTVVFGTGLARKIGIAVADIAASTGTGMIEVDGIQTLTALSTDTASQGDKAYWDVTNSRITTTRSTNPYAGRFATAKANAETTANIDLNADRGSHALLYSAVAASTAVTNTTTETLFDAQVSLPANTLKVGDVLKIRYQGIATATNSTDTLAAKLYIGGLTGTALISAAAVDVANNDLFGGEFTLIVRTIGASGTFVGYGTYKTTAAEGTNTVKDDVQASTAIDTTAAQVIGVSATWSVANAGNSCRLDILTVEHVG